MERLNDFPSQLLVAEVGQGLERSVLLLVYLQYLRRK